MEINGNMIYIDNANVKTNELEAVKKYFEEKKVNPEKLRITLSREVALSGRELFEKLTTVFNGLDIFIKVDEMEYDPDFSNSQVFTYDEMLRLFEVEGIVQRSGAKMWFSGFNYSDDPLQRENKIPFGKIVQANMRMENWVQKINNAKVDGKALSPFEKYLYAYQIVTQFKYTMDDIFNSRDVARVLTGKNIVCAGYSALLAELCRRVGIVCKKQGVHVYGTGDPMLEPNYVTNHAECLLYLNDPKYNMRGFYVTDPTNDTFDLFIEKQTSITHSVININEHDKIYGNDPENGNTTGERLMINECPIEIQDFSDLYFLRDVGLVDENVKLFSEDTGNVKENVTKAIKEGKFDKEFSLYMKDYLTDTPEEKRGVKSVTINGHTFDKLTIDGKQYSIEDMASDDKLFTNLALSSFALDFWSNDVNSYLVKRFFEKALNVYKQKNNFSNTEYSINKLTKNMLNIMKNDPVILNDIDILYNLASSSDILTYYEWEVPDIMEKITKTKYSTPTIEDFENAMRVVYKARGDEPEKVEEEVKDLISSSIWVADYRGWGKRSKNNAFANEARKQKPIYKMQKPLIEKLSKYLKPYNFTNKKLLDVLTNKESEYVEEFASVMEEFKKSAPENIFVEFQNLMSDIIYGEQPEYDPTLPKPEKIDNTKIRTWNSANPKKTIANSNSEENNKTM